MKIDLKPRLLLLFLLLVAYVWNESYSQKLRYSVKLASGFIVLNCAPILVTEDSVMLERDQDTLSVSLEALVAVNRGGVQKTPEIVPYTTVAGGLLGAVAGALSYKKPEQKGFTIDFGPGPAIAVGTLVGAGIGYLFGIAVEKGYTPTESYDLSQKNKQQKFMLLRQLIANRSVEHGG